MAPGILDEVWLRLAAAANDLAHPMRLFTLATTAPGDLPDARLMMLRGADRGSSTVWCHTQAWSNKVIQLRRSPAYCAVLYDWRDRVQVRLRGMGAVHEMDAVARDHFEQASQAAPHRVESVRAVEGMPVPPDLLWPARTDDLVHAIKVAAARRFVVLAMHVDEIEWLRAAPTGTEHLLLSAKTEWAPMPIGGP